MTTCAEYPLETAMAAAWPPLQWRDLHVVLAVSGGPDSTAMLRAVWALKQRTGGTGQLIGAHFNHGLRPEAADRDQDWLEGLCRSWQIPLRIGRADGSTVNRGPGETGEAAARQARYGFLRETAEAVGARFVAVAHTADDQIETVLHHMLRGTGLAGLAGMRRARPLSSSVTLIRPLLDVRRSDVTDYLESLSQDFRTDATNADPRWTRNRLRNELLPLLRSGYKADVDQSLLRLAQQADETQQYVAAAAATVAANCVQVDCAAQGAVVRIDGSLLAQQPPILVREVCKLAWTQAGWPLQEMGFEHWRQMVELLQSGLDQTLPNLPGGVRASQEAGVLVLKLSA